jgi:hypothetical protein
MAATRDNWVVCDEYTAGPFTPEQAGRTAEEFALQAISGGRHACRLEHRVVVSATKPMPPWNQALEGGR